MVHVIEVYSPPHIEMQMQCTVDCDRQDPLLCRIVCFREFKVRDAGPLRGCRTREGEECMNSRNELVVVLPAECQQAFAVKRYT